MFNRLLPMFAFRSFMVSGLIFGSLLQVSYLGLYSILSLFSTNTTILTGKKPDDQSFKKCHTFTYCNVSYDFLQGSLITLLYFYYHTCHRTSSSNRELPMKVFSFNWCLIQCLAHRKSPLFAEQLLINHRLVLKQTSIFLRGCNILLFFR